MALSVLRFGGAVSLLFFNPAVKIEVTVLLHEAQTRRAVRRSHLHLLNQDALVADLTLQLHVLGADLGQLGVVPNCLGVVSRLEVLHLLAEASVDGGVKVGRHTCGRGG